MTTQTNGLPPGPFWMVDDEPELVSATVGMLASVVGASQIRGTTDPREVAGWIEKERPTALITDVRMPHVNGLELVSRLHEKWGPVPVVVMTAFPTAQVDHDARAGRFRAGGPDRALRRRERARWWIDWYARALEVESAPIPRASFNGRT